MTNAPNSTREAFERARPFALTLLFGAAAFTITLAGTRIIADIIGPVFLALVITISLHPIRLWLGSKRMPEWAVSGLMLLAAYLLIFLLALAVIVAVAQVAALLPQYTDQLDAAIANAGNTLHQLGVESEQIQAVIASIDPGQIAALATSLLSGMAGVLTNLAFLIAVLFFLVFDTDATRQSLRTLGDRFPNPVAALNNFAASTRNFMGVNTVFGFAVAVIDAVALLILGIPGAFVWGVLAFVTSFIPNVGFLIGMIPPALIALLEGGPGLMIAVIAIYSGINLLSDSLIKPRVVGDTVGLSTTVTFLSLVFWTWVIGPLGALLAVPLTLLTKALLIEADPRTWWALPLIAGKPKRTKKKPKSKQE
ncbi:AI-2E family transporter [Microbacterium sp. B35-30]|uniref:AI-2E family transporter n=1 Tax=Microbacterium sp. B35-30 TaxID=1962642 RepID=UPI0013D6B968|nr:AI-2E family transporter [Microbacterium sp. B35-30]KAF2415435.1 hypothetical protein B2K11_20180 [Microbacterium sp. B35-30]